MASNPGEPFEQATASHRNEGSENSAASPNISKRVHVQTSQKNVPMSQEHLMTLLDTKCLWPRPRSCGQYDQSESHDGGMPKIRSPSPVSWMQHHTCCHHLYDTMKTIHESRFLNDHSLAKTPGEGCQGSHGLAGEATWVRTGRHMKRSKG